MSIHRDRLDLNAGACYSAAVCYSVLQCVAACCNVLQCAAVLRTYLPAASNDKEGGVSIPMTDSISMEFVAVCCSMLQFVAVF